MVALKFPKLRNWNQHFDLISVIEEIQSKLSLNYVVFDKTRRMAQRQPNVQQQNPSNPSQNMLMSEDEQIIAFDLEDKRERIMAEVIEGKSDLIKLNEKNSNLLLIHSLLQEDLRDTDKGCKELEQEITNLNQIISENEHLRLSRDKLYDFILEETPYSNQ
eukprot:TRINITY_DN8252_c0_g1_i8.p1 TRINITY_DN8252_c0_g1~~TRINITY_DN8252_c0_g1_i8.p1  ORF type:complete len:161 (-),score=30.48 TRINITY_DN8252_c0_g1_i8:312-794(-)